jgi:hypothetical protein
MSNKLAIYKVIDGAEDYYIKKERIADVPFRSLIIGRSYFSGKSNLLCNLLCRDEFYGRDFSGKNIFIVSPSIDNDEKLQKLIKVKEIPDVNLMREYNEEILTELYGMLEEEYEEAVEEGNKPEQKIIIFDDISYSGAFKSKNKGGILSKIFSNGRHILLSTIVTSQKYSDISTSARENASFVMVFNSSNKQLELIEADHNVLTDGKKAFMAMFRKSLEKPHSFFVINYSNKLEDRYMDSEFNSLKVID